ncbi:hypothetical protein OWV82_014094 [Melia azedarach]|uniref:Uncharacterized protein n=1 Tax=Melia azedarach TaxID=155640 RepID=A0ACC1XXU3_MELAZ|nr:hypothetical protein OWV82_014094 [Melia azedarach]
MVLTMRFAKLGHTVCSDYQLMVFLRDIDEHFNPNKNHDAVIVLLRRINDAVYDADDFYTQAERVDDRYKMVKEVRIFFSNLTKLHIVLRWVTILRVVKRD